MKVSILIAAGEGAAATMRCLGAIASTVGEEISFEVVVVDDGTGDGTAQALAAVDGDVRMIRNEAPRGVLAAWSQAAGAARGEVLVLMRHRAGARAGWLPALLAVIEGDAQPIAVRARVVPHEYPDGLRACVAIRSSTLRARSDAARAEAIERACAAAVPVPRAVVELELPDRPAGGPVASVRDVGGLGSFLATRLAGRRGDVLF